MPNILILANLVFIFLKIGLFSVSGHKGNLKKTDAVQEIIITDRTPGKEIGAKIFMAAEVDDNNTKWFLTDNGLVSYNETGWKNHNNNKKIPGKELNDLGIDLTSGNGNIWIATSNGIAVAGIPVTKKSEVKKINTGNTAILSNMVLAVSTGRNSLNWIGTEKGISAIGKNGILKNSYQRKYRENIFTEFPITSMAASVTGDSLYAGTNGAGVVRVFRDKVDAVSGASEYAQWGPIDLPSDNIYSICISADGTQWFGTDKGVARHKGNITLRNWTVFNTENGLINNFVQAIATDKHGQVWFGTRGGITVYNGQKWRSFSTADGLKSNNILCIAADKNNVLWIGTDEGLFSLTSPDAIQFK